MVRKCKYLTNAIYVDLNDCIKYIDEQNDKFRKAFVENTTYFHGLPISVAHENDNVDYGEYLNKEIYKKTAFAHIVSSQVGNDKRHRELDAQRLKTCHWVKGIIDYFNSPPAPCDSCQKFYSKCLTEKGENLTYIFCANVRYVVILQKITSKSQPFYIIKTAYYVDQEGVYRSFMRKLA